MKKILITIGILALLITNSSPVLAGDCKARNEVNWHATINAAVFLRSDCPTGDILGTVPKGEVIQILEVDRYNDFYLVETSVGTGFLYNSFLDDITKSPLPGAEELVDSIFKDLDPNHIYYDEIADVKERGIVSGNPIGEINADDEVNRAELAKILVEATTDDTTIASAVLQSGTYSDVESGAWYLPYLQIAKEREIMVGDFGKSTVRPADGANGAEVAKMIVVAFGLEVPDTEPGQEWYEPFITILEEMGALPYEEPSHPVTRGEMMFVISKVLKS